MAKKEALPSRSPTRKQILVSRKEQERLRVIYLGLALVGVLILIVLAVGLVQTYIMEPRSPIATINGEEISTQAYRNRVGYERFILEQQIDQFLQQQAALPAETEGDDQLTQLLRNQYQQLTNQLLQQRSLVDRQTFDDMVENKLVEAEAANRNITVTEEEVTEEINRILAGREGGFTAAAAEETSTARAEASVTAASWTPTPTFTPSPTLTVTETITEPTATPANTPTPGPTPTLNVISTTVLADQYEEWIAALAEGAGITQAQYRQYIRETILEDKLREALGEEVPTSAEQAHARHILLETKEEAEEVLERLETGEDFADLAAELSKDSVSGADGGDLGFVARGEFVEPVNESIFSLPLGQVITEPLESQFGWHVIEVLEREERELSPTSLSQRQRTAYDEWLAQARMEANIEEFWSPEKAPPDTYFEQRF